jgi:hypothetical protein
VKRKLRVEATNTGKRFRAWAPAAGTLELVGRPDRRPDACRSVPDALIFGKIGAGGSHIKDTFSTDQTGAFRCVNIGFFGNVTCVGQTAGGTGSYAASRWTPSFISGVGAERNLGALFIRGAVETETLAQDVFSFTQPTGPSWSFGGSSSTSNTQWTVRATLMGGVRF